MAQYAALQMSLVTELPLEFLIRVSLEPPPSPGMDPSVSSPVRVSRSDRSDGVSSAVSPQRPPLSPPPLGRGASEKPRRPHANHSTAACSQPPRRALLSPAG